MNYAAIRVLIVDDMSSMRTILKALLKNMGIEKVAEAVDGRMALEILHSTEVDVILSDWNMPHMTGIELLREVRADTSLKEIPFVMISAEATGENIAQAIQLQVSQYLIKPINAALLEQKLGTLLKNHTHLATAAA